MQHGRLNSTGKLNVPYGEVEALIKFTGDKGVRPAFWARGLMVCGHGVGKSLLSNPTACFATLHGQGRFGGNAFGNRGLKESTNMSATYHNYAVE